MTAGGEAAMGSAYQAVFLFTDIADSVALKRRLGDESYAALLMRHNVAFERAIGMEGGGRIVTSTGDGFLAEFHTSAEAVRVALRFQLSMHSGEWNGAGVQVRCALHSGMAVAVRGAHGEANLSGLAVDVAARVMGLAIPGQVLLTRHVFDDARQYVRDLQESEGRRLEWKAHGPYLFKGTDEPLEVYEVGVAGVSPLRPPVDGEKARRAVPVGEEEMYDWRPAAGLEVPRRAGWRLERKLGEGGFGEVWLGAHEKTAERRVFKFCFEADRLRSFKRELTLFRLLRDSLGNRGDIARLHEVNLEKPPYFLESEYSAEGDLGAWAERQGGIAATPMATRLDLVARTADAVAAAHSVGVLHKDLKPANILVQLAEDGAPRPQLSDFGIGVLVDRDRLAKAGITVAGFTVSQLTENDRSRTGTRMYAPPEQLAGAAFTAQGDVYSLGVLLYQMVVGDLARPVAAGWERDVDTAVADEDERAVLKADIAEMIDGEPSRRMATATMVVERVRSVRVRAERRRAERTERIAREEAERRAAEAERRRRKSRTIAGVGMGTLGVLLGVTGVFLGRERGMRATLERRLKEIEAISGFQGKQLEGIKVSEMARRMRADLLDEVERSARTEGRDENAARRTAEEVLSRANLTNVAVDVVDKALFADGVESIRKEFKDQPVVRAALLQSVAESLRKLGLLDRALAIQDEVMALRREHLGADHVDTLGSMNTRGHILHMQGRFDEAMKEFRGAREALLRTVGPDHKESISALNNIASTLESQGKYEEAEPMYVEALAMLRRVNGNDNPETLIGINNMGTVLMSLGRPKDAEPFYRECLERSRRVLGEEHPDTLVSLSNLGDLLHVMGRQDESLKLTTEALEKRRRVLGDEHPETLVSVLNTGLVLSALGRREEARQYFTQAYEGRKHVLGEEHPDTLNSMNSLAVFLHDGGEMEKAGELYRLTLELRERVQGSEHPQTLLSLANYASWLDESGMSAEGEALTRRAIEGRTRLLGADHVETLIARSNLVEALRRQWKFKEAVAECRQVIDGRLRGLGEESADTLFSMHTLASLLEDQGEIAEARQWYERTLAARERVLGAEHPDTLATMGNLANRLRGDGELEAAERVGRRAAEGARKAYRAAHESKGILISAHAQALVELKRFAEAEPVMIEAYRSVADAEGEANSDARHIADLTACLYDAWEEAEPGRGHAEQAAKWRKRAE